MCEVEPGGTSRHVIQVVSYLAYCLTQEIEAIHHSETSSCFRIIECYNPEDHTSHKIVVTSL
jgi:hypothetical protein